MPASPIRKLVPFANAAKARGIKVYHLNIGQPDIKTPDVMIDAMHNLDISVLAYAPSDGYLSYREKLCQYYRSQNINIKPDEILVTTGGSEAIYFTLFSCFDQGDEIIIPEPMYANYNGFSHAGGIKVVPVATSIDDGFALPSTDAFEALITERTKGIMLCNPNNPTGYLYSRSELEQLRDIVLKHNLFLIVDEVYREFTYDSRTHYSVLEMDGLDNHAIVVDSISKRYSACGARIGALLCKNKEVRNTALKFAQARLSPPTLAQISAEAGLAVDPTYLQEVKQEYEDRRNFIVERLNKIPGVTCPNPGGAFYCIAKLPVVNTEDFCKYLLNDFSHNNETIMLAPAAGFYGSDSGLDEVRIAYVLNKQDIGRSMDILELALVEYGVQNKVKAVSG